MQLGRSRSEHTLPCYLSLNTRNVWACYNKTLLFQAGPATDGVTTAAVRGTRQPHSDACIPATAHAVSVLAVFAFTVSHRQALPTSMLLEMLQHCAHPSVRSTHCHVSLLWWWVHKQKVYTVCWPNFHMVLTRDIRTSLRRTRLYGNLALW